MRQKRAKSYRKQMLVYNHTFKFREPYQVLVDDQIVMGTYKSSFDLAKGLKRTLQAEVKPMITQCCMQALYATKDQGAIEMAKTYERRRCNHPPKEPKTSLECIESVVNFNGKNKHRYVVATQDIDIRRKLRRVPGVPLIYMNRSVMVMEPLSEASERLSKVREEEKLFKGLNDPKHAGLAHDESVDLVDSVKQKQPSKKKGGPKEPNPLSVKRKRDQREENTKAPAETAEQSERKRRKRRHGKPALKSSEEGAPENGTAKAPQSDSDSS